MALIFSDDFETGSFSAWDTDNSGTAITVNATAALAGTAGVEISAGCFGCGEQVILTTGLPAGGTALHVGFRADRNDLSLTSGDFIKLVRLNTDFFSDIFGYDVINNGGSFQYRAFSSDDGGTIHYAGTAISSGVKTIEARVVQATSAVSADGSVHLFVDGTEVASASNIDNYNIYADTWSSVIFQPDQDSGGASSGSMYVDDFVVRDDDTQIYPPPAGEFRFLGFDADTGTLMVSGLKDTTTLKLYDYDLSTLTENGTASFGAATNTELDNRTRGIFPASKPMEDDVWYLRGRDGSNVQVYYNDRNGTLGWTNIGPGTATWGTAKYAVGLHTSPTSSDDVIAVFDDNDIYRNRFGTITTLWVKMGDADTNTRASARHIANRDNELLIAGTAAGTLEFSNNFGATWGDVSGTALGTINAIEVSL